MLLWWTMMFFVLLCVLVILYKRKHEEERSLFLQMLGYFILGGFTFSINALKLPLGFLLVIILFSRIVRNRRPKMQAAFLGLLVYLTQIIAPAAEHYYYELPRSLPMIEVKLNDFDFSAQWKAIVSKMNVLSTPKMDQFKLIYNDSGEIQQLSFGFIERVQEGYTYYRVNYEPKQKKVVVHRQRLEGEWLQYERSIPADVFFDKLNVFDLTRIKAATGDPYLELTLQQSGTRVTYAVKDARKSQINAGQIREIHNSELPVEGYWITACGMYKEATACDDRTDYFFDMTSNK